MLPTFTIDMTNEPRSSQKISVVVILYYSKHLLPALLTNIKEHIVDLGEILLINNCDECIDEFESDFVSVIYTGNNLGYGGGINFGVARCKFETVLILNPDVRIDRFQVRLDANNYVIMSGHNASMPGYSLKFPSLFTTFIENSINTIMYSRIVHRLIHFERLKGDGNEYKVDYVSGALMLTNKATLRRIGGFDTSFFLFYEETDLCHRAKKHNIPVLSTGSIVFTPISKKASSIDVSHIKTSAGINSAKIYHTKYDGPVKTSLLFGALKVYYFILTIIVSPMTLLSAKAKKVQQGLLLRLKYI